MSASPANTNDLDQVEPRFVVKVAALALAIHLAFGPWAYGPYAVIVFFSCWRLSASGSKESRSSFPWKRVGWRALAAVGLLVVSFLLGAIR
jgi:hypothetical protein